MAHGNAEHCRPKRRESDNRSAKRTKSEKFGCRPENCGERFATRSELYRHKIIEHYENITGLT